MHVDCSLWFLILLLLLIWPVTLWKSKLYRAESNHEENWEAKYRDLNEY